MGTRTVEAEPFNKFMGEDLGVNWGCNGSNLGGSTTLRKTRTQLFFVSKSHLNLTWKMLWQLNIKKQTEIFPLHVPNILSITKRVSHQI